MVIAGCRQLLAQRVALASTGVLLAVAATGCSSHSLDGLTVPGLHEKARAASGSADPSCPVPYDIGKAASKAEASGAAAPLSGPDAVTAVTPESAGAGSSEAKYGITELECDYRIGDDDIATYTAGSENKGSALDYMLPRIAADTHKSATPMVVSEFEPYLVAARKAKTGAATLTPSGNVASVRLPVSGKGEIFLVVAVMPADSAAAGPAMNATQLTSLAQELAAQARW